MRKHLLTTLLTLTLIGGLIGCGKSETAKVTETPVVEEETVTTTEVSENTDEVEEVTEKPETEEVRKPNASAHYKEWRNKQKEAEATEEVAEVTETEEKTVDTKKEDKKATETKTETPAATTTNNNTTSAASNNTNNNTNNNSTPAPQPTKTETAASTPAKTEAPSPATCNHTFTSTRIGGSGHGVQVGTGQYEQVIVDMKPGDPIYDEYGAIIGSGPETPVYETREVTVWKIQKTDYYQDTCTKCGYTTTRSETVIE